MRVQLARLSRANTERQPTGINEPNLTLTNPINLKKTKTKVMLKIPENDKVKMVKITNYELQTQKANTTNSKYYKLKYHKNQPCVKKILHRADL